MKPEKKQVLDLADEFLTDVATNFFDTRCKLDAMIEAFEAAVSELRREADRVAGAAAALWTVLIEDAAARGLFVRLDVDPAPFAAVLRSGLSCRLTVPSLWGRRRRYRCVVVDAYQCLAAAVNRYRDGLPNGADDHDQPADEAVYYYMVREMARLINQRIAAVNRQRSPSDVLQYVKQFDPAQNEREFITGGGSPVCGLDERLCYRPLDFEGLDLPVFPRLAPLDQARPAVIAAADAVYKTRPDTVAHLLNEIKRAAAVRAAGPVR